jgi:hypothetical protein
MHVNTQITLGPEELYSEKLSGNATQLAALILRAVGGDATVDVCNVSISDAGSIGQLTPPPAPPVEPTPAPESEPEPEPPPVTRP